MRQWPAGRVALVFEDEVYTHGRLEKLAGAYAAALTARGVKPGDRVALMGSNRPEWVAAVLATWRVGAAVALFSPSWKQAETEHAIGIVSPACGIGDHPVLAGLLPTVRFDDDITGTCPPAPADPDAEAVLVFSSGTTGLPKAVRHTHRGLAAAIAHWRDCLELTSADRLQVTTPPSHILGILNIVTCLELGIWLRLHPRFDLDRVLRCVARDRITVEMAVAPIALAMARHPDLESYDLSSLRFIMWGATPVTTSVARVVTDRSGVGWVPAYGASENPVITCNPVRGARLDSVGKAAAGVELRVVSLEDGSVLPAGEAGELQLRSPSLMAGYLPAAETAQSMADGWYRTGDVGYIEPDGWVHLTDRCKEMIKVRGFQVAPAEVEGVLLGHPSVADAAVFGVPDEASGESIIAAVVLAPGAQAAPHALAGHVAERLASYKKPRQVLIVDAIPRLPSGKALRRLLKEDFLKEDSGGQWTRA
ncbi:MAG TPA: AMP-binding protein [Trebonia sp.]|nr:AMP-binding protein [Trebonia sp.]